jgi:23S rRNA (pseudouridine1915-N3)-methyltransferase
MKIVVLSVGRVRQPFIREGEAEYLQRIRGSFQLEVAELGLESPDSMSAAEVQEREAKEILKKLKEYDYVIALDERGKRVTSEKFAALIESRMNAGTKSVCIIIGGAYGFSESVRQAADYILSLSDLTFPHQLVRLVVVEQCYRAFTMLKGIRYHK